LRAVPAQRLGGVDGLSAGSAIRQGRGVGFSTGGGDRIPKPDAKADFPPWPQVSTTFFFWIHQPS
jgi:hypothetical protein